VLVEHYDIEGLGYVSWKVAREKIIHKLAVTFYGKPLSNVIPISFKIKEIKKEGGRNVSMNAKDG
jgi:hypothetical protein